MYQCLQLELKSDMKSDMLHIDLAYGMDHTLATPTYGSAGPSTGRIGLLWLGSGNIS